METIDFKKDSTYKAKTEPQIVEVPKMLFVMVDGTGGPESSDKSETEFQQAMQVIFGIVYTIKFWYKKYPAPKDYAKFTMAPIEALWWSGDGKSFDMNNQKNWKWTVMLRLPEFVTDDFFNEVVANCIDNKKSDIYEKARLEYFTEGPSVQIMHIGPYDQEGPNIEKMHTFARESGYELVGKHHELYFGDPRRTAPEKLHTILRQPVQKN
jgi:hypothetical protein